MSQDPQKAELDELGATPATVGEIGLAEDLARADLYGLLAALLHQPPSQDLLDRMASSLPEADDSSVLAGAWRNLVLLTKNSQAADWRKEYDAKFVGVGRPNVFLNGSYFMAGHLNEKPLVEVRRALQTFGLEASESVSETEDHLAALCEVMRYLIAGDDVAVSNLTNQKLFFNNYMRSWYEDCCDAIENAPDTHFYLPVAQLIREFFAIEAQGFDMVQ